MWKGRAHIGLLCLLSGFAIACNDKDKIVGNGGEDVLGEEVSIAYLKSLYSGHPLRITGDYRVKGCVMSTDAYGNFYKTIAIEDGTGGLEIRVDKENLYRTFFFGHIVELHCNSLTLGAYSGLVQIGASPAGVYEVGYIGENALSSHLRIVGQADAKPEAARVSIPELSPRQLSCLIRIYDVQFADDNEGLTWAADDDAAVRSSAGGETGSDNNRAANVDPGAAIRRITDRAGNELTVYTSSQASFADWILPQGSGYIEGILSYFNGSYQLRVVDPANAEMRGERF